MSYVSDDETRPLDASESRKLLAQFKELRKHETSGLIHNLEMSDESVAVWRFELKDFDTTSDGGRQLEADLRTLRREYGEDKNILCELRFWRPYPENPPLVRVIRPRMRWYTGHVSAGGSICSQMLVNSGTKSSHGWQSSYSLDAVIRHVKFQMTDCESTTVNTPYNGVQRCGPLRIDLEREFCSDPMSEYSLYAAMSAYDRAVAHHAAHGW